MMDHPADIEARPRDHAPERFRLMPASEIGERGTICSFLLAPKEVGALCAERGVTHATFHNPAFGLIFSTLMGLWNEGDPIDVVTLTQTLANRNLLEQVGGAALISELFTYLPTATNITHYVEILQDMHLLRQVITTCVTYASRGYDEQDDPKGLLQELAQEIAAIAGAGVTTVKSFKESLMEKVDRMQERAADADEIPTGLEKLDQHSPLRRGDMPLIAGERKAGKSILAITIASNAIREDFSCLYFSLEDRTSKVIDRIFANESRIAMIRHHADSMNENEMAKAMAAITSLCSRKMQIRDDLFDLTQIVAATRQQKTKWPDLGLIVVDYAQLVRAPQGKGSTREREVATVSRTLRLLAMETNAAVLLLSQLNTNGEARESKSLEQDATAAWMVNKPKDEDEWNSKREISVPWQRNGDSGIRFTVAFHGHLARMENL